MRLQRIALIVVVMLLIIVQTTRAAGETVVRVNQVGYITDAPKQAIVMSSVEVTDFVLKDAASGTLIFTGKTGDPVAHWSDNYPNVYQLDFTTVTTTGTYIIEAGGAQSPAFKIDTAKNLYSDLLANGLTYFQTQRDGADVPSGAFNRKPSHLTDQQAAVYEPLTYNIDGFLVGDLKAVDTPPVDVSGGWFDAGDHVKFVETSSFVTILMLIMVRDGADAYRDEARYGLDWLNKMWDSQTKTLYFQVGIGDGNGSTIEGDHDYWRLPESDDALQVKVGDPNYYIKYRPVLRSGEPGARISPNLAGRLTAAFALCYQVFRSTDPAYAETCLRDAQDIFDLADTNLPGRLLTTSPYVYYPEFQLADDMELGAAELYRVMLAGDLPDGLIHPDSNFYLSHAAAQASRYFNTADQDTFTLYDISALAHAEFYQALAISQASSDLQAALLQNMKNQLDRFATITPPFGQTLLSDVAAHAFGVSIQASLYDQLTQTDTYRDMQHQWLNWGLGANAWGSSFVVGAGATFPQCLHHPTANLSGSLDGTSTTAPLLLGATVNGPNDPQFFDNNEQPWDAQRPCPANGMDAFAAFNNYTWRYVDRVNSWPTVEPANDYTILSLMAFMRTLG